MIPDDTAVRRVVDELCITTDRKDWPAARALFGDGPIDVNMSSLVGGGPVQLTADQFIAGFRAGLHASKLSHHMRTNYRIDITGDQAEVFAGWRLIGFRYDSKLARGDDAVRTHTP